MNVKPSQCRRVLLILWLHFQNHLIFVCRLVDRRDLSHTKGITKRGLNLLNRHTQRRGLLAIDVDVDLWCVYLKIAIYILNRLHLPHILLEQSYGIIEIRRAGALQRDLIEAARGAPADIDGRWVLNKSPYPRLARKLRPQFLHDLIGAQLTLVGWLEDDEDRPSIAAGIPSPGTDCRAHRLNIRVVLNNFGDYVLMLKHIFERNALCGFGAREQQTAVATWYEPF